jgi:hypothetical protein
MGFQSSVQIFTGFGVPGELYQDAPSIVQSYTLNSALASYNVIGAAAFTVTSQGFAQAGSGGALGFAGILVDPKNQALFGAAGGAPLSPTLVLPNYAQGELLSMGIIVVTLPGAAAIGDWVVYDNTTGALETVASGAGLPSGKSWANAIVTQYTVSGAGLAVIQVNPGLGVPT